MGEKGVHWHSRDTGYDFLQMFRFKRRVDYNFLKFHLGPRKLACNYCSVKSLAVMVGCKNYIPDKVRGKSATRCDKRKMTKSRDASGQVILFQTKMYGCLCLKRII